MKVDGKNLRPVWLDRDLKTVKVIDQRRLPHEFVIADLKTVDDIITAIKEMYVRGAPLIGVTAAYGIYLAVLNAPERVVDDDYLLQAGSRIKLARPTAVNLAWAVDEILSEIQKAEKAADRLEAARRVAGAIADAEADNSRNIGEHGLPLIEEIYNKKGGDTVNLLTHCNAGWLATIEYGTATAPMYVAHDKGLDIHIWVDETRPLNQATTPAVTSCSTEWSIW